MENKNPADIAKQVKEVIIATYCLQVDDLENECEISTIGDSLDSIQLVLDLEDKFHCKITDADAKKIKTVGDAIEYFQTRL